jgi:beta-galactosidase
MTSEAAMQAAEGGPGPTIRFGAAYYHEYQPYDRLKTDIDLMHEAHLNVIRVGESVWSTWEPTDGTFELDWLEPILDRARDRGIAAVLGTPTYAIPAWMARKYPEIMAQRRTGRPIPYGHRQNVDYSHPAFRFHAERVVRRIVARYAPHPAVIGYQVDNEPGAELFHNRGSFEGFRQYLETVFGDVDEVNRRWGLTYWSHRLSGWEDLWTPDGNTNPGYALAWRRYQAAVTADFIAWQRDIVREQARPDQFVTTCLAYGRPGVRTSSVVDSLDVAAINPYYPMQSAFGFPERDDTVPGPSFRRERGVWWPSFEADLAWGMKGGSFLVTETVAGSIGESHYNYPAYDGQWRQAAWLLVARGARMIEYWHWHTLHYGQEMYWGGILGHSLEPGRCYAEIARIGAELVTADEALRGLVPDADVTLLRSEESRWALEFNPPLAEEGSDDADPRSYDRIFASFYRGCFATGRQVAVLDVDHLAGTPEDLVARSPVLVVPALYVAGDDLLDRLRAYAAAGGHLVVGFRSGYVDGDVQARHEVMPARLTDAVGAHYLEFTNLARPVPLAGAAGGLELGADAAATAWADGLVLDGATALATYVDRHLERWPAVTTHAFGAGRVTYVGSLLNPAASRALAQWLVPEPRNAPWRERPASVGVTSARNAAGDRLHFVFNWSHDEVTMAAPGPLTDLVDGTPLVGGDALSLGPWDVRVLVERASP